jgi:2-polyprenyl-3-methyl-5-hydroxy-6-metoxy-1,4-benzoquinol methylase
MPDKDLGTTVKGQSEMSTEPSQEREESRRVRESDAPGDGSVHPSLASFDANAGGWEDYTTTPRGRLRQELTQAHLAQHLDLSRGAMRIMDAGGGTGSYALPLAQLGHTVCLLDFSSRMLDMARQKAAQHGPALVKRIEFCHASAAEVPERFAAGSFDLVLCHTLLEYVPDPWQALRSLIAVLRPGGWISLLFANPHAAPLHWALARGDLDKARLSLHEPVSSADLFHLPRRTFRVEETKGALTRAGVDVVAAYGVRIFADYMPADRLSDPAFYARLLSLETAASTLLPYRLLARYHHLLGRKETTL